MKEELEGANKVAWAAWHAFKYDNINWRIVFRWKSFFSKDHPRKPAIIKDERRLSGWVEYLAEKLRT